MAVISSLIGAAASIADIVTIVPRGAFGAISINVTLRERHSNRLQLTEHPVEQGAQITDHSFNLPDELEMECGWSNASTAALLGFVSNIAADIVTQQFSGGSLSAPDYVSGIYGQLLALKQSRQPFTVQTSIRTYMNMLFTSLVLERDQKTDSALMVRASLKEVILVSTSVTTLPPASNQLNPANTGGTENLGTAAPVSAQPSPGGAVDPSNWTAGP